jgi:hypothetical protein
VAERGDVVSRLREVARVAERREIAVALVERGHSRTYAAKALGISRRTLLNKIKQYGLTRVRCNELAGAVLPPPEATHVVVAVNQQHERGHGSQAV